jgi:hypothetical protein
VEHALERAEAAPGPRGLRQAAVAGLLAARDTLEMGALAAALDPPARGPWWRAADEPEAEARSSPGPPAHPAALVAPPVLHELARHGFDEDRIAAAAHSLAWLTERGPSRLASAVLYALVLGDVAAAGALPTDLDARAERFTTLAERWGGGEPEAWVGAAIRGAAGSPRDPSAASEAAAEEAKEPVCGPLAAALVAATVEPPSGSKPAGAYAAFTAKVSGDGR